MAVSVVGAPDVAPSVVTITVHITLNGEELPPEASRLLSDLEALAASQAGQQIQRSAALTRTATAGQPQGRTLRLVEPAPGNDATDREDSPAPAAPGPGADAKVKRIGRAAPDAPSLYLCTGSRLVLSDGAPVPLTRREYDLFLFLCEHPRRVFSRAQLLRQVWGYDMVGTERTVDVHVRRLRVKLGDAARIIATVRGVGYRLDDDAAVQVVVRED
ncbi:winged helix-turn-helix domain-containing protein [Dactylosporangium sp. CA-092794]|uniref:winged helix-turn-helix domain-containing protein n=1 Tax=Dactylosporangium sp. CA-092794 TaxID=3239929 RepID=UPI003D9171B3